MHDVCQRAQTDASASQGDLDVPVSWIDERGLRREQQFHVPSTRQCAACHAGRALGIRSRQLDRTGKLNRDLTASELGSVRLTTGAQALLDAAFEQLKLTARSFHGVLRVARTIADLEGSEWIEPQHAAEAVQFRRGL